jgi:flagellar hook protein FlgE
MGLSASLYAGTSGLKGHGEAMSVIGNNISNVSTVGFKGSRMHFEDALSQEITTAAGVGQVGRGVQVGAVMANFSQGSLETTTESTDLAIGGNGFFEVSPPGEEVNYFTRAGNFRFDQDGYLVDPHGYRVQGWEVQQENTSAAASGGSASSGSDGVQITGVPGDIRLENFQSPPEETSHVDMIANLDSGSTDSSTNPDDPFFAMFENWDSTKETPLGDARYAYQSTIKVYDENGTSHNMTTYFDPVSDDISPTGGNQYWEYMVTVNPNEDNRTFWDSAGSEQKRGVLMTGTLEFNSAGELANMSGYTLSDSAAVNDLSSWSPAQFSQNGYPICTPNFLGNSQADFTDEDNAENIEMNFGLNNRDLSGGGWSSGLGTDPADVSDVPGNLIGFQDSERSAQAMTNYSTGSTTVFQSQDGYGPGYLENISVDRDGVITGNYSNGQVLELYALTLADFNNEYGLHREGGNLFSETRSSGPALTNLAGTGGLGTVASNSLEQSNVDLATEFVKMITTEKGFQANSKTITTTDTMLSVLINLKR